MEQIAIFAIGLITGAAVVLLYFRTLFTDTTDDDEDDMTSWKRR